MPRRPPVWAAVVWPGIVFCLSSCSSGPPAPRMGTPEWLWKAAAEQFTNGELAKAQEHLEKLMATENPFRRRAAPWHLVVLGGLARGHFELAEAYDSGSTQSKSQAGAFRRVMRDSRRLARQYALGLAQETERLQKEMGDAESYALEFPFPRGLQVEFITLDRVRKGALPTEGEQAMAERRTIERGVLLETASMVGAGEDTAKAAQLFKSSPVQVPRAVFWLGVADCLFDQSRVFDRRKLNEPDKQKILLELATRSLKPAAEAADPALKKNAKLLQEKIEKEQKAMTKA